MSDGKIDGSNIVEQIIAGVVLVGLAAGVTHAIDKARETKKKRKGK